jgi:hypothetical protein
LGAKNLDRIPASEWRRRFDTVDDFARGKIEVISSCQKCALQMAVNLGLVARISGPRTSLWNRKERCRRIGCAGFVEFQAKFPGKNYYETLSADDREQDHE